MVVKGSRLFLPPHPTHYSCHHTTPDVIMAAIVLNTLVMGLRHFGQPKALGEFIENFNFGCAALFTVEAMIRILGLGVKDYWSSQWNRYRA